MITKEIKTTVSDPFRIHKSDTGGSAVQIAVLTTRINDLTKHLSENKKDFASRLGLLKLVGQRRRLLNYLAKSDEKSYQKVIAELKIRK